VKDMVRFEFKVNDCDLEFKVESFNVIEETSKPFHIHLSLLSTDADISFDTLIRQPALLSLYGQGEDVSKQFHGVVSEVRYLGTGKSVSRYQVILVPQFWFLSQRQDCRIFQEMAVPDIIDEVLSKASISDYRLELSSVYLSQDYILQYRESDSVFLQRLMAEYGIWYYFEHTEEMHTMVIVDSNDAIIELVSDHNNSSYEGAIPFKSDSGGTADREHILNLESINRVKTGAVVQRDYNYIYPKIPLEMESAAALNDDLISFDYPGRYNNPVTGQKKVTEHVAEYVVDSEQIECTSNVMRLASGYSINIDNHPRTALNRDFTILRVSHNGYNPQAHEKESSGLPTTYDNSFVCIPRDVIYQAPKMPSPVVDGPQTAVVVGPANEEIYTDKLGRIKVQFHWDRYGENDENAGCWIRLGQTMAGANWGAVCVPRIGHEVIVTFLDGDPDRPLVTGAVYNSLNLPPYSLPEHKTKTTFRTQTHKGMGFNELSFEDEANQEEVYIRAQKDMSTLVQNNRFRDIINDEFLKVGRHQTNEIKGDHNETIDGYKTTTVNSTFTETVEQDVTVKYNANETQSVSKNVAIDIGENRTTKIIKNDDVDIGSNYNLTVGASRAVDISADDLQTVGGNLTVSVTGNNSYKADGATQIVSADKIVFKTGGSQLVMNSDGSIKISGSSIMIEGSDKVVIKGGKVAVN